MFNTYSFIFIFLPIVVIFYYLLAKINFKFSKIELIVASILFYALYSAKYIPLIVMSILINYYLGNLLMKFRNNKILLGIALMHNISILIYFKYFNFFIQNINTLANTDFMLKKIILPLGISFYTFQQIAYVIDCYRMNSTKISLLDYTFSIVFFAKLPQGPIVHYKDIISQYKNYENYKVNWSNLNKGMFFFTFGLLKKIIIADNLSGYVVPGFDLSTSLTFIEAWSIAIAYALQIYFDFSGYTDMALGIGYFFNINIPNNFKSPYQANSIIDFWGRWHITLGEFLKNYVYITLGGNKKGNMRKNINLFLTMLISGIWHGANWTFIAWGGIHGVLLIINHRIRKFHIKIPIVMCRLVTFLCVVLAWVIFRASTFHNALKVYKGMLGINGIYFNNLLYCSKQGLIVLAILFLFVMFIPNTEDSYNKFWKPSYLWLISTIFIFIFILCVMSLNKPTQFLYLQF